MRLPVAPPCPAAWDPVPRRAFDATLVTVATDEGVTGYGSGKPMGGFAAFAGLFRGQDPCQVARHVRTLEPIGFHASRYWPLEAALWDITGKVAGLPVAALFGGARTSIPAYASFGELKSPAQRAEAVRAARAAGLRAVKIRIDRAGPAGGPAAVRAARGAAGGQVGLPVRLDQGWGVPRDI